MRVVRDDCGACDVASVVVRMTLDEARSLAREIRDTPGPWSGPFSQRLTERIDKVVR